MQKTKKITVVGAGFVGSACTSALAESGLASTIVLVDVNRDKAEGECMDISHGAAFVQHVDVYAGEYQDTKDSDVVVITAGANQKPGETRLDLIAKNVAILKTIVPQVVRYSPNAIILVVANPVDILSLITYKLSGLPARQVIGSGTVLDSSRLRYVLGERFDINPTNIHAHILGEHGDSEFASWSNVFVGSVPLAEYCKNLGIDLEALKQSTSDEVRNSAYQIIQKKGYTNYAIALAVRRIVEAILRDDHAVLSISSYDAANDIYYSRPAVVGANGWEALVMPELDDEEAKKLEHTQTVLKDAAKDIAL